jgi:spore germination protein GerM
VDYPVKVYFSKHPDSDANASTVVPVNRVSPTLGVATYALQQLIAGPTGAETAAGFFSELGGSLTGASSCGGADFQYTINNVSHTGTLRFCRQTQLAGDLVGPRIKAQINATLTQFPNVTKVVILNSSGHCFDDLSGMDVCLH